jgi:membrane associated rhomboid family serine protease
MWPRLGASKLISRWIVVTLVASIAAQLDGGFVAWFAALAPARVWHGELWRLVTWPLVEMGPLQLVVTCLTIYKFGGELATRWGDRRLLRFVLRLVIGTAVVTTVFATLVGATWLARCGGWAMADVLVIAWARQFPRAELTLYGFFVVSGDRLVAMTLGVAVVFALYFGVVAMAPELIACAAAAMYPRGWLETL